MLNLTWKPTFGTIYTWLASDVEGQVSFFVNNNFGDIPKCILGIDGINEKLDTLNEFIFEESSQYKEYFFRKNGAAELKFYSSHQYRNYTSEKHIRDQIEKVSKFDAITDATIPAIKGLHVYYALEGNWPLASDHPAGYEGTAEIGDYFHFLPPTKFASINEFPKTLQKYIAKSSSAKFPELPVIRARNLNQVFDATC